MINDEFCFKCNGKTKYPLNSFITKDTKEARLTNEERRQLLTIFNFRNQASTGGILIGIAFIAFIAGIAMFGIMDIKENIIGNIACFILPAIVLLIAGIYILRTAPKAENCIIKAYEMTVTDMKHKYYVYTSEDEPNYEAETLKEITQADAAKYGPFRTDDSAKKYFLFLELDGKWVELQNRESFTPIRFGIKVGDKVRCAVLECGEYCYISLF